jgi:hypothetical protein
MDERVAHNAAIVAPWTEDDWSRWYFKTFREKDHRPLRISARSTITSEIEELFENSSEDVRHRMKRGLIDALRSWDEGYHGLGVLRQLAWTAGKLRVAYATGILLKVLVDNRERMSFDHPFFDTADIVLGVLTGFAVDEPDKRIETGFDGLFHDDAVAPHFAALLALGISICNPERFVEAFNRFVEKAQLARGYFVASDIFAQFAEHLTLKKVKDNLDLLTPEARAFAWRAGVEAKLLRKSEIVGLERETVQEPGARPLPYGRATPSELYDRAKHRVKAATELYRGRGKSVMDETYAAARALRRPRGRA